MLRAICYTPNCIPALLAECKKLLSVMQVFENYACVDNADCYMTPKLLTANAADFIGHIFSHVRPFYELAVSNLDRSIHRSLWV